MELTEKDIKQAFDDFDKDRSGEIDFDEFKNSITGFLDGLSEKEAKTVFNYLDKDHNGVIDYQEFQILLNMITAEDDNEGMVKLVFITMDADNDGKVTLEEFSHCSLFQKMLPKGVDLADIFEEMDKNNDGFVDFEEFIQFFSQKQIFFIYQ